MWTEVGPFDFDGKSIQLKGAVCEPQPLQKPHPSILIGGAGDRVLRIVAEQADIWNYPGPPSPEFLQRNELLNQQCDAIGRDPNEIVRSMQMIIRNDDPNTIAAIPPRRDDQLRCYPCTVKPAYFLAAVHEGIWLTGSDLPIGAARISHFWDCVLDHRVRIPRDRRIFLDGGRT
jgi:Luciferase-like monooxygenase